MKIWKPKKARVVEISMATSMDPDDHRRMVFIREVRRQKDIALGRAQKRGPRDIVWVTEIRNGKFWQVRPR